MSLIVFVLMSALLMVACTPENALTAATPDGTDLEDTPVEDILEPGEDDNEIIDLIDIPENFEGVMLNIEDVESGFDAQNVMLTVSEASCADDDTRWHFVTEVTSDDVEVSLRLTIPKTIQQGQHFLSSDNEGEEDEIVLQGEISQLGDEALTFTALQEGVIGFDNLPSEEGDMLTGAFQFDFITDTDDASQEIFVEGYFNLEAPEDAFCNVE